MYRYYYQSANSSSYQHTVATYLDRSYNLRWASWELFKFDNYIWITFSWSLTIGKSFLPYSCEWCPKVNHNIDDAFVRYAHVQFGITELFWWHGKNVYQVIGVRYSYVVVCFYNFYGFTDRATIIERIQIDRIFHSLDSYLHLYDHWKQETSIAHQIRQAVYKLKTIKTIFSILLFKLEWNSFNYLCSQLAYHVDRLPWSKTP